MAEGVKSLSRLILAAVALAFAVVMLHYGFGADGKAYYGAKGAVEILLFAAIGLVCSVVLNTGMKRLLVLFKNSENAWSYVRALLVLVLGVSVVVFAPAFYLLIAHGFVIDFG
ncbi:MAG: hypothetical protein ACI36Y_00875 [Coriobacteriales bacterium]